VTCWGTWIEAVVYYRKHFQFVKTVIDEFEEDEALAIKNVQYLMADKSIKENMVFIKAKYRNIPSYITRHETSGISLAETMVFEIMRNLVF